MFVRFIILIILNYFAESFSSDVNLGLINVNHGNKTFVYNTTKFPINGTILYRLENGNKLFRYYLKNLPPLYVHYSKDTLPFLVLKNFAPQYFNEIINKVFKKWLDDPNVVVKRSYENVDFVVQFDKNEYPQSNYTMFVTKYKNWHIGEYTHPERNLEYRIYHNVGHMLGLEHLLEPLGDGISIMSKKIQRDIYEPTAVDLKAMKFVLEKQRNYENNINEEEEEEEEEEKDYDNKDENFTKERRIVTLGKLLGLKTEINKILQRFDYNDFILKD